MMTSSGFVASTPKPFPAWVRYLSLPLVYGLGAPLTKSLEAFGKWPPKSLPAAILNRDAFRNYQPDSHDVFACCYGKSGTNWLLQIAVQIAYRGGAEFENIHHLVPWPDAPKIFQRHFVPLSDAGPRLRAPSGLRVIKTHLASSDIPYNSSARYIALVRDPKDVCVSAYHFLRGILFGPMMPSVQHWVDAFTAPSWVGGSWAAHVHSYWTMRTRDNVLFLTYEEMNRDNLAIIHRIARHMGVELSPAEFNEVAHRSSFNYMKTINGKFGSGRAMPWGKWGMIRRGESGGSAELLSAAQQRQIDDHCRAELKRLGCDFPYDEVYGKDQRST